MKNRDEEKACEFSAVGSQSIIKNSGGQKDEQEITAI